MAVQRMAARAFVVKVDSLVQMLAHFYLYENLCRHDLVCVFLEDFLEDVFQDVLLEFVLVLPIITNIINANCTYFKPFDSISNNSNLIKVNRTQD